MARIFVTRALPGDALSRLAAEHAVEVWPEADPPSPAALRERVAAADGLLAMLPDQIDAGLLAAAPRLRVVALLAVGYDNVDMAAATARRVLVTNTPGVLTETVADLTFALLLAQARRLPEASAAVREGRWPAWRPAYLLGRDVHGATLGIVGLGAIGLAVARRGRGFGMRVLYTSRRPQAETAAALGIERLDLDDLLRQSDYVSLHVPLTPATRGLIGARELTLMKATAVLVNTARGAVVDQEALTQALARGRIGAAAFDVFAEEPLAADDPLLALGNVVVAPHVGSATVETRERMADLAVANLLAFFRGERPPASVNPEALT